MVDALQRTMETFYSVLKCSLYVVDAEDHEMNCFSTCIVLPALLLGAVT